MTDQASQERLSFLRSTALPGLEILRGEPSSTAWRVFHERYAVTACESVSADLRYRGWHRQLRDRTVVFFEPGEVHCNIAVPRPQDFKVLFIDPALAERALDELGVPGAPHFQLLETDDAHLLQAIRALSAAIESGESDLEQQSLFAGCLRLIAQHAEKRPPLERGSAEPVRRAKQYLLERYNEAVSLDELAAVAGISRFRLAHVFTKAVGLPPHAWQMRVRIERASGMLRRGIPGVETATQVGFADQSHFTRHFKRVWGMTPSRYAAAPR